MTQRAFVPLLEGSDLAGTAGDGAFQALSATRRHGVRAQTHTGVDAEQFPHLSPDQKLQHGVDGHADGHGRHRGGDESADQHQGQAIRNAAEIRHKHTERVDHQHTERGERKSKTAAFQDLL